MRIVYRYSARIEEGITWARERLGADISPAARERLLSMVREIREGDPEHTIATLAKRLGLGIGVVQSDLEYLQGLGILELEWEDRLPDLPDRLLGFDDGSIFYYYPETANYQEIRIQDEPEFYGLLVEFCRQHYARPAPAPTPTKEERQKALLFSLLTDIHSHESLITVSSGRGTMEIKCEAQPYEGDRLELIFLLDLLRQKEIINAEVHYTRAVTHDVKAGSRQPWASVRVELRWRPGAGDEGFAPLWRAIRRLWPAIYNAWAREKVQRMGLGLFVSDEHYQNWLQLPLSSLGGRTPLEIIEDEGGLNTLLRVFAEMAG
jgi:DNA-binding transcriptional ArsR family regulator